VPKIKICSEDQCKNARTTEKYCRLHYLRNWKRLKKEKHRKAAKRLNNYVESVVKSHPDGFLDKIKSDISEEKPLNKFAEVSGYRDELDEVMKELGYSQEESVENIISNIKIDDEY
jgi:hypothetical protein